jgi:hypothetical protein
MVMVVLSTWAVSVQSLWGSYASSDHRSGNVKFLSVVADIWACMVSV